MKLYADAPARRSRQVVGDLLVLAWVVAWTLLAVAVYRTVMRLAELGRRLEDAGREFSGALDAAGEQASEAPLIGDTIREALGDAGGAGTYLVEAGRDQQHAVRMLGLLLALAVAAIPIVYVLMRWLPGRLAWARDAEAARRLATTPEGIELLAVRAITRRSLTELSATDPGAVSAWRRGEPAGTQALAHLELRSLGVGFTGR